MPKGKKPMFKINHKNIYLQMARKELSGAELAKRYGVTSSRMNYILASDEVLPLTAGKLARALECDVLDIVEF